MPKLHKFTNSARHITAGRQVCSIVAIESLAARRCAMALPGPMARRAFFCGLPMTHVHPAGRPLGTLYMPRIFVAAVADRCVARAASLLERNSLCDSSFSSSFPSPWCGSLTARSCRTMTPAARRRNRQHAWYLPATTQPTARLTAQTL
jgi:hypothetical protein